jgi:hypothetical protein
LDYRIYLVPEVPALMNHRFRLLLAWFAVLGFLSAVVILRDGAAEQTSAAQAEDQKSAEAQSDAVSSDKARSSAAEAADENPTDGAPAPDASTDSPIEVMLPPLKGSQLIERRQLLLYVS